MPKRSRITLEDIAAWENLVWAAYRAAQGKRLQPAVSTFVDNLDANLRSLRDRLLDGSVELGHSAVFRIFDPKPRTIHAPVFRERVLHHALIRYVGPVLENSLVADTFACRVGKGAIAAARRAQHFSRRYAWFGKLDVRHYFASICHTRLLGMLEHKFKDRRLLELLERIIRSCPSEPGRGLPIGTLTSQNFANFYLTQLDRLLLEKLRVRGMVRYMDDVVWWCDSRADVQAVADAAERLLHERLSLQIRPPLQVNRSIRGIPICGFRVFPGRMLLSVRRRKLYSCGRRRWESRFDRGEINAQELQSGYAATLGITLHADASAWRMEQLKRQPPLDSCRET